ncbi:MAG: hypothetical protein ACM3JH_04000 [Acidithiobacillales bacterium]
MEWVPAIVGVLLLAFGRRLYWLFVGGIGFVVGFSLASRLTDRQPGLMPLLVGLGAGLLGIVLALVLQRVAVIVAGLLAGAWLGVEIWPLLAPGPLRAPWLPALVGAVAGALLAITLFDAVLVVLSSLVGAALLARLLGGRPATQAIVLLLLALLGIVLQTRARRRET